jgi:hypothetical protein
MYVYKIIMQIHKLRACIHTKITTYTYKHTHVHTSYIYHIRKIILFYLRCSYYKIKIIWFFFGKNEVIRVYTSLSESSQVYTSISHLIFEHIIVFTNDSFIIQTETNLSLTEPNRAKFTSS